MHTEWIGVHATRCEHCVVDVVGVGRVAARFVARF